MSKRILYNISSANLQAANISGGTLSATTFTGGSLSLSGNLNVAGTLTTVNITSTNLVNTNVSAGVVVASTLLSATGNSNTIGNIVTTGGNVGIGTTSPGSALHVNGAIGVSPIGTGIHMGTDSVNGASIIQINQGGSTTGRAIIDFGYSGTNLVSRIAHDNSDKSLEFVVNTSTTAMVISSSGNVGIGTTSPGAKLQVDGPAGTGTNGSVVITGRDTYGHSLYIGSLSASKRLGFNHNGTVGNIFAYDYTNTTTQNLCLQYPGGNVGIGTTAPAYTLDVDGTCDVSTSITTAALYSTNLTSTNIVGTNISAGTLALSNINVSTGTIANLTSTNISSNSIILNNNNNSPGIEIGVGTGSTTSNLTLYGSFTDGYAIIQTGSVNNTTSANLRIARRGTTNSTIANFQIYSKTSAFLGGDVGIGTTSPGESLDVRGNLRIGNSTQGNYIAFSGTLGDEPGNYNHTYVGERKYSGSENSELLLFKGNDISGASGPDRIRLLAANHLFDTYTSALSGTFEGIGTSGTTRMLIDQNGNIGIGCTAPTHLLSVGIAPNGTTKGSISINTSGESRYHLFNNAGVAEWLFGQKTFSRSDFTFSKLVVGTETDYLTISTGGNVGIGTSAPAFKLDINGDMAMPYGSSIRAGNVTYTKMIESIWQNSQDQVLFYTPGASVSNASPKLCIQQNGNVGIGTTTPGSILDVVSSTPLFTLRDSGGGNGKIYFGNGSHGVGRNASIDTLTDGNDVTLWTNGTGSIGFATVVAERMRINNSGNIGVAASSPVSRFCINTNDAGGNGALVVQALANTINGGRSQDGAVFRAWADNNTIIDFRNNVGGYRGGIWGSGSGAVAYNTSSDIRLKENITDLTNSVNIVKSMRPVEFTWKSDNVKDFGFIAQEFYQVIPGMRQNFSNYSHCECNTIDMSNGILCDCEEHDHDAPVDENGNPLYYSLDYGKITPYLTKALQETMSELETTKQDLLLLKQFISSKFPGEF